MACRSTLAGLLALAFVLQPGQAHAQPPPGAVPGGPPTLPGESTEAVPAPGALPGGGPGPMSDSGTFPGGPGPVSEPGAAMPAATNSNMVKLRADVIEYDRQSRKAIARGNVTVSHQGTRLTTESLHVDQASQTVHTEVPFILTQQDTKGSQTVKGSELTYNLKSQDATVKDALLTVPAPAGNQAVIVSGRQLLSEGRRKYVVLDGTFSTCDEILSEQTPHYHMTATRLELVPEDYAMGWDAWVYLNNRRLFWVPFFWVPLKKRETSVAFGQNDVEGFFVKTTWGYRLSDQHSGTLYTNWMQKKGLGLGVSHNLANLPTALSLFETYGLAQSDPNPQGVDPLTGAPRQPSMIYLHGYDPDRRRPFDDYLWHVRHQQRLFDTMTVDLNAEDYNIYTVQNAQTVFGPNLKPLSENDLLSKDAREDHAANSIAITDQRSGINYSLNRSFREERGSRGQQPGQVATSYSGNANWAKDGTALRLATKFDTSRMRTPPLPPGATPSVGASDNTGQGIADEVQNLDSTLHLDQALSGNTRVSWDNRYTKRVSPRSGNLPPGENEELTEKIDLTSDLGWGNAQASIDKLFLLKPERYFFPPEVASPSYIVNRRFVERLPELKLTSKPLLPEIQPFTLIADMGRYFESAQFPEAGIAGARSNPAKKPFLAPISRFRPSLAMAGKAHPLGLGSTLDFGNSGFEQRFYSTGDAGYSVTANALLRTNFASWLSQDITYRKVLPGGVDDPDPRRRSTTPFLWDAGQLNKETTINAREAINIDSKLVWTHNFGYDYVRFRYADYTTSLNFNPDPRVSGTLSTGYHFKEVPYLDLKGGRWQNTSLGLTVRSTAEAFGGTWGQDSMTSGIQFSTQFNWDPHRGKIASLTNNLVASLGDNWSNHWEIYAAGSYDLDPFPNPSERRNYRLSKAGISRDLHDFILSFEYDRQLEAFIFRLRMTAFNTDLINISNNTLGSGNIIPGIGPGGIGSGLPFGGGN
ncbi:MAG: LPS-assembly protein LptD [Cyanobacteria bacterium NC_groundwater_1444_Ag_S-0.65um_54_12]|nr:LPS-assembly protein LptD [Cyanobacteria bacterium NC_groundwater_1444_Ag_S-0.65um_54_12]